jgi:transposase
MTIITRKIEVYVNEPDKETKTGHYNTLHEWRRICHKAANLVASHYFTLDNIQNMVYLDDGFKVKLADRSKNDEGILTKSHDNAGYQMLSRLFKGQIKTDILSNLNNLVRSLYKDERMEYVKGNKSLRSYRDNIPMPFSARGIKFEKISGTKNYQFVWFKIPMATVMGADRSGNEYIVDRILNGEYKMCNSSIKYDKKKNKWFLLLCVEIPDTRLQSEPGKTVEADLNLLVPIIATCNGKSKEIGTKDEFLYQRVRIQSKLNSLQTSLRWTSGGKGRQSKLQAIDRFNEKEKKYVTTKMHTYSRALVDFAISQKAEKIVLVNQELKEEIGKDMEPVLRNWSYYGLRQMIEYKSKRVGILTEVK